LPADENTTVSNENSSSVVKHKRWGKHFKHGKYGKWKKEHHDED